MVYDSLWQQEQRADIDASPLYLPRGKQLNRNTWAPSPRFPRQEYFCLTPPLHLSCCSRWATTTIAFQFSEGIDGRVRTMGIGQSLFAGAEVPCPLSSWNWCYAHWVFLLVIKEPTKRHTKQTHVVTHVHTVRTWEPQAGRLWIWGPHGLGLPQAFIAHLCLLRVLLSKWLLGHWNVQSPFLNDPHPFFFWEADIKDCDIQKQLCLWRS